MKRMYAVIECRIECPKCGGPLPLNGPLSKAHCDRCQNDTDVPDQFWADTLGSIRQELDELREGEGRNSTILGLFHVTLTSGKLKPRCSKCKKDLAVPGEGTSPSTVACPECARVYPVSPAPERIRKLLPSLGVIVGAAPDAPPGVPGPDAQAGSRPVIFYCPQCNAPLKVDGRDRLVGCKSCGVDVYLPDGLWLRLHPVTTVERWFAGFL